MHSKEARVRPNAGYPLADQSGVLSRRYRSIPATTAAEEELTWLLIGASDVTVDRLSGLLRHLEPDRLAGLLLAHGRAIDQVTMRRNVLAPQADDIASCELARWLD
jgi:hypothetical protein